MLIIPVLDIKHGLVVRARMGQRDRYFPIETPLSPTAEPVDVAQGLRAIYPFQTFYIADLDAIESGLQNTSVMRALASLDPAPEVWIDAGFRGADGIARALAQERVVAVLGSETQTDTALLSRFTKNPRLVLSLDFRGEDFFGPPAILANPDLWPPRVIVMTLARVGANAGPDFDRLKAIKDLAAGRDIIAAGGVRNATDLERLEAMGVAAALVATALHRGAISGQAIAELMHLGQR